MRDELAGTFIIVFILIIIMCAVGFSAYSGGKEVGRKEMEKEAVKANAAKYIADENGEVKFEWIKRENK